jgi:phosphoenolpyruvate carboxykinase (ATP)
MNEAELARHGLTNMGTIHWNLPTPFLYEEAIRRHEGRIAHLGPLVVRTGHHTGRSPDDKFIVREPQIEDELAWGSTVRPMDPRCFERLHGRLLAYLQGRDLFVQDRSVGADPAHRFGVRVITETAWHSLFARTMFPPAPPAEPARSSPTYTVLHAPGFHSIPELDGTRSEVFIVLHLSRKLIVIGGTAYAGEIKKSVFTAMNYELPKRGLLTMHSAANLGPARDTALFFGLSGTGKTALSTDPGRRLIGDDEHAWGDDGVFNLENGCYAKVIHVSAQDEPEIHATTRRFGTILENVGLDSGSGRIDLDDDTLTENTRAAYPLSHLANVQPGGRAGHPSHVVFLTADAFGVLPPIARLTSAQAIYHFLSGYTAKLAGTEGGVREPRATFSPCFGAPFMALPATVYARLLHERLEQHGARVWLVNTGWTGGPYGVGHRIAISTTRALVRAALDGALDVVPTRTDSVFGLAVPTSCPGVEAKLLDPRLTWADPAAYDERARQLAAMFVRNFASFAGAVADDVRLAEPHPGAPS